MDKSIRKLGTRDRQAAQRLLGLDPVAGGLIHGLLLREDFAGDCEFWGLFEGPRLAGVLAPDGQGRCPVFADGAEWAPVLAGYLRERRQTGRPAKTVDLESALGLALAGLLPPLGADQLAIWFRPPGAVALPGQRIDTGQPAGLAWRPAAPADEKALMQMYAAEPSLGWVNVRRSLRMCQDGHRLWLIGSVAGSIVTAGWANTLEPGAGRISGILTVPAWRRRGLSTELMRRLVTHLQTTDRLPYLYVGQDAAGAQAAYRKLGFVQHSERITLKYAGGR